MKFTVLGHACLYVEHNGTSVLIDPWLVGSCYWRSWWNFPEPDIAVFDRIKPDYIYITHLHWDHFHGPTLRRFDRRTHVLLPLAPTRRMVQDIKKLGFENVSEIAHGTRFKLSDAFALYSYQFGPAFVDSAVVLSDGKTIIFNANDCKLFGLPLKQITSTFGRFDFVFRSHSNASQIPYCIEGYEHQVDQIRSKQDYIEEFTQFCAHVNTKYAIPFASNHCFLHKDTLKFNDLAVSPHDVCKYFIQFAEKNGLRTQCRIMASGSSWDEEMGFDIRAFDYENKKEYINMLLVRHKNTLARQETKEAAAIASFELFRRYFQHFFAAVPKLVTKRFSRRVIFRVDDRNGCWYWLVDLEARTVQEVSAEEQCDIRIDVDAFVLNDCARKRMFSTWGPSKRLKISLYGNATRSTAAAFFMLLDAYENDMFPILTWRHLMVGARRWRELVEFGQLLVSHKLRRKPFVIKDLYPTIYKNKS